jgi:hypothetical protein
VTAEVGNYEGQCRGAMVALYLTSMLFWWWFSSTVGGRLSSLCLGFLSLELQGGVLCDIVIALC